MYTGRCKVFWFHSSGSAVRSKWFNSVQPLEVIYVKHLILVNCLNAFKHVLNLYNSWLTKSEAFLYFVLWVLGYPCVVSALNWACKGIFQILRMVELHPYRSILHPPDAGLKLVLTLIHLLTYALADEFADAGLAADDVHADMHAVWYGLPSYGMDCYGMVWQGKYESADASACCCWCTRCILMQMRWTTTTPTLPVSSIGLQPILGTNIAASNIVEVSNSSHFSLC